MVIPAYDEINLPCDCCFEELIIFGIISNKPYLFFENHKLGKLVDVMDDPVNVSCFKPNLGRLRTAKYSLTTSVVTMTVNFPSSHFSKIKTSAPPNALE